LESIFIEKQNNLILLKSDHSKLVLQKEKENSNLKSKYDLIEEKFNLTKSKLEEIDQKNSQLNDNMHSDKNQSYNILKMLDRDNNSLNVKMEELKTDQENLKRKILSADIENKRIKDEINQQNLRTEYTKNNICNEISTLTIKNEQLNNQNFELNKIIEDRESIRLKINSLLDYEKSNSLELINKFNNENEALENEIKEFKLSQTIEDTKYKETESNFKEITSIRTNQIIEIFNLRNNYLEKEKEINSISEKHILKDF